MRQIAITSRWSSVVSFAASCGPLCCCRSSQLGPYPQPLQHTRIEGPQGRAHHRQDDVAGELVVRSVRRVLASVRPLAPAEPAVVAASFALVGASGATMQVSMM